MESHEHRHEVRIHIDQKPHESPNPTTGEALYKLVAPETTIFQYTDGVSDLTRIAPENWVYDQVFLDRPGNRDIQMDLFYDYRTNLPLYPKVQAYFRKHQPPTLIVWGKNDKIFPPTYPEERRGQGPRHVFERRRIDVLCIDAAPNSFLARELAERGGGVARFLTSAPDQEDITTALDEVLADWAQPVVTGLRLEVNRAGVEAAGHAIGRCSGYVVAGKSNSSFPGSQQS